VSRYVAFLRAINVGGHTVRMEVLRRHFEELGHRDVTTFIASGNVAFTTRAAEPRLLASRIEARLGTALGYEVATFVRTAAEVAAVAGHQPFDEESVAAAWSVNLAFLEAAPGKAAQGRVLALQTPFDEFHFRGPHLWWLTRRSQAESTISGAALEKALGARVTVRGVKTVRRIADALAGA